MVDETDDKIQKQIQASNRENLSTPSEEIETGYKELYIEPVSYILNDDCDAFLPPSKALVLGLLPIVSAGFFYSDGFNSVFNIFDDVIVNERHHTYHNTRDTLPQLSSIEPVAAVADNIVSIAYKKPVVGAKDFKAPVLKDNIDNGRNVFASITQKMLAKEISAAINEPIVKPLLSLQAKPSIVVAKEKKAKIASLDKAAKVRLVSPKSLRDERHTLALIKAKKIIDTGEIVVIAHDDQGRANVLKTDYFVYKNGQEIQHKKGASAINFKLPIGDYVLQAVHSHGKNRAIIREMKIVVKPNSVVFPVFVFSVGNSILKKEKVDFLELVEPKIKSINGKDLKIPTELLLHNEGYDQDLRAEYLEVIAELDLPTGIGYVSKK